MNTINSRVLPKFLIVAAASMPAIAAAQESNFQEVWTAVKSDPYTTLPEYHTSLGKLFSGGVSLLRQSAQRTLSTDTDLLPNFQKLVHPIGICFAGTWTIDTKENPYTGYFASGSQGQIIVRASEAMGNGNRGDYRAFGLAGKIYPTLNSQDPANYKTANFFTVDDLGGTHSRSFLDLPKTNAPATSFHASQLLIFPAIAEIARVFATEDANPGVRQVYPVSELGLGDNDQAVTPLRFMLKPENTERPGDSDFRNELRLSNFPGGLIFGIYASESADGELTRLGEIKLTDDALSESCDHRLHFAHPRTK